MSTIRQIITRAAQECKDAHEADLGWKMEMWIYENLGFQETMKRFDGEGNLLRLIREFLVLRESLRSAVR
jgi:hypothetical protein